MQRQNNTQWCQLYWDYEFINKFVITMTPIMKNSLFVNMHVNIYIKVFSFLASKLNKGKYLQYMHNTFWYYYNLNCNNKLIKIFFPQINCIYI